MTGRPDIHVISQRMLINTLCLIQGDILYTFIKYELYYEPYLPLCIYC